MAAHAKPIVILLADDDEEVRMLSSDALAESRVVNDLRFVENMLLLARVAAGDADHRVARPRQREREAFPHTAGADEADARPVSHDRTYRRGRARGARRATRAGRSRCPLSGRLA